MEALMTISSLPDISVSQIQAFIAVAEHRSFSRASLVLNIEQSTLSKRISLLEQSLDLQLFRRDFRPIDLTPIGKELFGKWKQLLTEYETTINEAYHSKQQISKRLLVCTVDSISAVHSMPLMRTRMKETHPGLTLQFEYISFSQWRSKLLDGEIDLVLTVLFESTTLSGDFEWAQVSVCPKSVCMLKTNPLSRLDKITFEDLSDQSFLLVSPSESPAYEGYVLHLCRSHGFEPKISRHINNAHGLFSSMQSDNEVVICDRYFRDFANPLVKSFDLPDTYSGMIAVWKRGNHNPYIKSFVDKIKDKPDI
jgi:DNA-binding transcriptional LysR family regulator